MLRIINGGLVTDAHTHCIGNGSTRWQVGSILNKILSKRIAERSAYCKQKFWYVRESSLLYYQGYWKKFQKKLPPTCLRYPLKMFVTYKHVTQTHKKSSMPLSKMTQKTRENQTSISFYLIPKLDVRPKWSVVVPYLLVKNVHDTHHLKKIS